MRARSSLKIIPRSRKPGRLNGSEFHTTVEYSNWRPEGQGDYLLLFTIKGRGIAASGRSEVETTEATATLFEPDCEQIYYTADSPGRWEFLYAHFVPRTGWQEWLDWPTVTEGLRFVTLNNPEVIEGATAALREMVLRLRRREPVDRELALNALQRSLLLIASEAGLHQSVTNDQRIRSAMNRLRENIAEPFRLEDEAAQAGLSVSRFAHLFRNETGVSPGRFAEESKLFHAGLLLETTSLSVSEVAEACGYQDPFYFSNRFRGHYGASPRTYRERRAR